MKKISLIIKNIPTVKEPVLKLLVTTLRLRSQLVSFAIIAQLLLTINLVIMASLIWLELVIFRKCDESS